MHPADLLVMHGRHVFTAIILAAQASRGRAWIAHGPGVDHPSIDNGSPCFGGGRSSAIPRRLSFPCPTMWTCIRRNARAQPCHRFGSADGHETGSGCCTTPPIVGPLDHPVAADKGVHSISVVRRAGVQLKANGADHVLLTERTSPTECGPSWGEGALTAPSTRSLVGPLGGCSTA